MARVRDRDVAAFEQLYDGYHRLVYGIALRLLSEVAAAEDVTQSVFLKLWSQPDIFQSGNFGAWIARVSRNRALDVLRTKATRPEGEMPEALPLEDALEDIVFAHLNGDMVRSALSKLPNEQRGLIEMGFFGGITHEEIARKTQTPLGTVKTRIRAGLRRLRAVLEGAIAV
ncbi:MAG: sigma-70 family RNA polymerase sigma factor [Candidatus Eremiobacteraeota bacterium]|nr:sigma-70 family RNA polymerase sigma factor [Candidatus Eremiobacteraeota bacterium]